MIAKDFPKPMGGVVQLTVCSETGMLPTEACGNHLTTQWYLSGTQPISSCTLHSNKSPSIIGISRLKKERYKSGQNLNAPIETSPLKLNLDFLNGTQKSPSEDADTPDEKTLDVPDYNPFME